MDFRTKQYLLFVYVCGCNLPVNFVNNVRIILAQVNVVVLQTIFVEYLNPHYGDRQLNRKYFSLPMTVAQNI